MYFESFLWQVYSRVSRAVVSYDILNRKLFGRLVVRVTTKGREGSRYQIG